MTSALLHRTLGPYQLLRVVADGLKGTVVYEALDPAAPQRLAVRVLPLHATPADAGESSFPHGAGSAATELQHPNIVTVHDWGWHGDIAFIATEFVEGETLAAHLRRVGRLPVLQGLALAAQLLSALEFAHGRGVLHGAVHPRNLLVSHNGQLKVAGFGWATAPALISTRPGLFDQLDYLAPEQVCRRQADHRADVYSAAVVAYELLTGAWPFSANARGAAAKHGFHGMPIAAHVVRPELPLGLHEVFERALAPSPAARYQHAAEFSAALQAAVGAPIWVRPGAVAAAARIDQQPESREVPKAAAPPLLDVEPRPAKPRPQAHRTHRTRRLTHTLVAGCVAAVLVAAGLVGLAPPSASPAQDVVARVAAAEPANLLQAPSTAFEPSVVVAPPVAVAPPPVPVVPPAPKAAATHAVPKEAIIEEREPKASPRRRSSRSEAATPLPSKRGSAATRNAVRQASTRLASLPPVQARQPDVSSRPLQRVRSDLACHQDLSIARQMCEALRCATTEFDRHPVCVRMRAEQQARNASRDWNN